MLLAFSTNSWFRLKHDYDEKHNVYVFKFNDKDMIKKITLSLEKNRRGPLNKIFNSRDFISRVSPELTLKIQLLTHAIT